MNYLSSIYLQESYPLNMNGAGYYNQSKLYIKNHNYFAWALYQGSQWNFTIARQKKLNQNKKYTETHIIIAFCFNSNY